MKVEITFKNLPKEFKNWYIGEVRSKRKDYNKFSDDVILRKLLRHPKEILFTYVHKWLREVYEIYIEVWSIHSIWEFTLTKTCGTTIHDFDYSGRFKTYEEALESGLHELLKLTKNKQ